MNITSSKIITLTLSEDEARDLLTIFEANTFSDNPYGLDTTDLKLRLKEALKHDTT